MGLFDTLKKPIAPEKQAASRLSLQEQVAAAYPGLTPYLANMVVQNGQTNDDRQLEYYAPWESDNPNQGKNTVEIYNKDLQGDDLRDSVALDMLHYLGASDPSTGKPVSPDFYPLKMAMSDLIMHERRPMDAEAYKQDKAQYPDTGSYEDWMNSSRADAYIRGLIVPRLNPEWQEEGIYTPEMKALGDRMRAILLGDQKPKINPAKQ